MFTGAFFTIAKTWNQPKWPSTEEWNTTHPLKNDIMLTAVAWMELEIIRLSEVSWTEEDKH